MGNISRLGDGQDVDQDFLNELVDGVNLLTDVVYADQNALVWNGQSDGFNNVARIQMIGGVGSVKFSGKSTSASTSFTYGGINFTQYPFVFVQPYAWYPFSSTISSRDNVSCNVTFQRVDGGKAPVKGAVLGYTWLAFGPTA